MIINIKNGGKEGGYAAGKDKKRNWGIFCWMWIFPWMEAYLLFWELPDAEKV